MEAVLLPLCDVYMRGETDGDGEEMLGTESLRASVQWMD
jgi:hypothetical protein